MSNNRLRRSPAAQYVREKHGLSCSAAYLEKLASTGGGALFYRVGGRVGIRSRRSRLLGALTHQRAAAQGIGRARGACRVTQELAANGMGPRGGQMKT